MRVVRDSFGNSTKLYCDQLNWQIITRANAPYLRVWDSLNPFVKTFKGFKHFDLDPNYIFEGEFEYYDQVPFPSALYLALH